MDIPKDDRRKEIFSVTEENRDKGKTFRLTEMFAWDAEDWAMRVAHVLFVKQGVQLPEGSGMAGLATLGSQQIVNSAIPELRQLVRELMACIEIVPDPKGNPGFARPLEKGDVSEIITLLQLKVKVVELHLGFSIAELRHRWTSALTTKDPETSNATQGSAAPSGPSSPPTK